MFHEKANMLILEAIQARFIILKANWIDFARFWTHFELAYNMGHNFWTTGCTAPIIWEQLIIIDM